MELIVVLGLIGLIVTISIPMYQDSVERARETALRESLATMRRAIDEYHVDRRRYPESLDELVRQGYLRKMPVDPITGTAETWVMEYVPYDLVGRGEVTGVWDVASGAQGIGRDGSTHAEW